MKEKNESGQDKETSQRFWKHFRFFFLNVLYTVMKRGNGVEVIIMNIIYKTVLLDTELKKSLESLLKSC